MESKKLLIKKMLQLGAEFVNHNGRYTIINPFEFKDCEIELISTLSSLEVKYLLLQIEIEALRLRVCHLEKELLGY